MKGNGYTFCELREKEVINIVDGRRLGHIIDMAMTCRGQIYGLICPASRKFIKNVSGGDSIFVPWQSVQKIGADTILVELTGNVVGTLSVEDETPPS